MEDVDEDEDEEEVVFLGDVGCAAMRAVAALWAATASAAATAGRMEGMSSGCGFGGGWLEGPRRDLAARRADPVGSGGQRRQGAAVSPFRARLGWAPAMREGVRFGVRGGGQFAWAAFGGRGDWARGFRGVCGGHVRVPGQGGRAMGRGAPRGGCVWVAGSGARWGAFCGRVCGGRVWFFGWVGEARVTGPGAARVGGRV